MRHRLACAIQLALIASFLGSATGCGLFSKDLVSTTFDLPPKTYSFDTSAWHLPAGDIPAVPCGDGQAVMDCCHPPDPLPQPDCSVNMLSCDAGMCALHIPITLPPQKIDLKMEVPALGSFSNQSVINVSITQITYTYASTMNVDLPPVDLYIAPQDVSSPSDPSAKKFGTTKVVPAGSMGQDNVILDPAGGAAFTDAAHHFGTPFNFIASTEVVVPSGSPIPSGGVTITVQGKARAGL
ncbi:MAG TPA: hypothetical protein VMU50_02785 [Polyangia bacterium]|nr:hypothetical protein [Polyangia bacterium]